MTILELGNDRFCLSEMENLNGMFYITCRRDEEWVEIIKGYYTEDLEIFGVQIVLEKCIFECDDKLKIELVERMELYFKKIDDKNEELYWEGIAEDRRDYN
jgi:hypothetical protein